MIDNTDLLFSLLDESRIRLHYSEILKEKPEPLADDFTYEKIEGMLLGLAIGDALGATSEGKKPGIRYNLYGEIRDYLPGQRSNYRRRGAATDDTQLAFRTLEQLVEDNGLVPDELARRISEGGIVGAGGTTKTAIKNYKELGIPWYRCGPNSLGNGALMRIAPIIIPYLKQPSPSMYADAAIDTMITHNAYGNTSTCIAFVKILWLLLSMKHAPDSSWWLETYVSTARDLEGAGDIKHKPRVERFARYNGPVWKFTNEVVSKALNANVNTLEACESWGSGASLFETVPSVIYILAKYSHDPEEAIVRAVNDTKDNDTHGSIVGAAVGALHGIKGIPDRWIKNLTGRIRKGGTGQVFRLIFTAKKTFWLGQ